MSNTQVTVISAVVLLWLFALVECAPVSTASTLPPASAIKFMRQFGYLEQGPADSEALYSEAAIVDAIKTVQKFGDIPQTGKLDNATLELMVAKRCGVPDVVRHKGNRQKRFVVGAEGWRKRHITYFVANWSPKLSEEDVVTEMKNAFKAWSGYARLSFHHVQDPDADITVAFGRGPHQDGYPFDGPGNILAHAFYPYEMDRYGGDIHFDDDENWKIVKRSGDSDDGVDFFTVAVHELGHSLGLAHSPVSTSIMFPYYKGYQSNFQLGYDDILAMYELYIARHLDGDYEQSAGQGDENDTGTDEGRQNDDEDNSVNPRSEEDADTGPTSDEPSYPLPPNVPTTEATVTFIGDDETVEDHKGHDDKSKFPTSSTIPDICEGNFDAISVLRGELFIFKQEYMWRLSRRGEVQEGYPVPFRQLFWKLPNDIVKIDAIYQRDTDGSIILFTGNKYWVYNGDNFIEGSPRPLTDFGLPPFLDKIDAAIVWGKNGKTFLYSKDMYWRYNDTTQKMDPGYPHNIERWRGVPPNLDAAMTWTDGFTYFFKGRLFWRFDNTLIKTDDHYPLPASQHWIGCPEKPDTIWW
ncbi:matrix metalloproteinase-25-like [Periplaneta americana]|uniref:matrix metalloproteinase-25-like n=1 Tax=Periplaneta americana TaxID=6978 RepID=UPI0037E7F6D0